MISQSLSRLGSDSKSITNKYLHTYKCWLAKWQDLLQKKVQQKHKKQACKSESVNLNHKETLNVG